MGASPRQGGVIKRLRLRITELELKIQAMQQNQAIVDSERRMIDKAVREFCQTYRLMTQHDVAI